MKIIIIIGIVTLLMVSIVISQSSLTKEIKILDSKKLNLTKEEKGIINNNYENLKLGKVTDYQKGTYHTFINLDSGYRIITTNKNFNKMKNEK